MRVLDGFSRSPLPGSAVQLWGHWVSDPFPGTIVLTVVLSFSPCPHRNCAWFTPTTPHTSTHAMCHSYLLQTIRQHMVSLTVTAFQVQGWHPHHCLHFTEILPSWWRHLAFWLTSPLKSLALTYFSFFTSILLSPASLISLLTSFWCRYSQVSSVSHWSLVTKC